MNLIRILALHACREQLRNRSFQVTMLFAGLLIYASLLFGVLAVEQEVRALMDFGLGFIELMALALVVFGAATGVLREMETKTIYLILTRPVSRAAYLLGRYFGLVLSASGAVLAMAAVHLTLLFFKGWAWQWSYPLALLGILLKIGLAAALTSFIALATTSVLSALTMIGIIWTLGHFVPEISFLARQVSSGWTEVPLLAAARLLPDLQILNFRDRPTIFADILPGHPVLFALGYATAYSAACLASAHAWIRKKEF